MQRALNATNIHSTASYERVSTSFPSLIINGRDLGHISFGGGMAGSLAITVAETLKNPETIRGGQLGGPVAFFDRDYTSVVILSPLNHFMVANMEVESDAFRLDLGLMGSIEVRFMDTQKKK